MLIDRRISIFEGEAFFNKFWVFSYVLILMGNISKKELHQRGKNYA
jgi:hypothetical protein